LFSFKRADGPYIDGTKKLSGIEMRLKPANLKSIRISHASTNATGETYLDNIKFYRYEVSGPVVRDVWFTDGTGNKTEPALHIPLGTEKITLRFYDPVAPSSCAAAVRLRTDSGDAVPFSGSYNTSEKSYTLTPFAISLPKNEICFGMRHGAYRHNRFALGLKAALGVCNRGVGI
jgi:hypothetical protein